MFCEETFTAYHGAFMAAWPEELSSGSKMSLYDMYFRVLRNKLATYHKQAAGTVLEAKPKTVRAPKPKETPEEARARLEAECLLSDEDEDTQASPDADEGDEDVVSEHGNAVENEEDADLQAVIQLQQGQRPDQDTDREDEVTSASRLGTAVSSRDISPLSDAPSEPDNTDAAATKAGWVLVEEEDEEGREETSAERRTARSRKKPAGNTGKSRSGRGGR